LASPVMSVASVRRPLSTGLFMRVLAAVHRD
jgi:hypothetical protein